VSAVEHPSHYGGASNPYEAIKVIEDWRLGFSSGNALKYILRAGRKGDAVEDLRKACWYLRRVELAPSLYFSGPARIASMYPSDVAVAHGLSESLASAIAHLYQASLGAAIASVEDELRSRALDDANHVRACFGAPLIEKPTKAGG
jgi:hypothetical protein